VVVLGEAVGFIADELEEFEPRGGAGEAQFLGFPEAVDDFLLFGQGEEQRHFDVEFPQGPLGSVELSGAAIDEEDVGADTPFLLDAAKVSVDHLFDHGQVVLPGHGLDAEPAVARFERLPIDEGDQ